MMCLMNQQYWMTCVKTQHFLNDVDDESVTSYDVEYDSATADDM